MPRKACGKAPADPKRRVAEISLPPPDWPVLHPLVSAQDVALETLLDDQIILIRKLFTSTLCKKYVSFLSSLPLITTPIRPRGGDAVRVSDRIQFDDSAFAEQLWSSTALKKLVNGSNDGKDEAAILTQEGARSLRGGEICGLNPRIRIYRYGEITILFLSVREQSKTGVNRGIFGSNSGVRTQSCCIWALHAPSNCTSRRSMGLEGCHSMGYEP